MALDKLKERVSNPKGKLAPDQFRNAKPIRNPHVTWETADDGSILLVAPLSEQGKGFMGWVARRMKLPDQKQFELEPVGALVWEHCDGNHTNASIAKALQTRYKMNRLEAEASLSAFLQTLSQRRLVTLMVSKPSAKKGSTKK